MNSLKVLSSLLLCLFVSSGASATTAKSPNGLISLKQQGSQFEVLYAGRSVLTFTNVGVILTETKNGSADGQGGASLSFVGSSAPRHIDIDYTMLAGKRLHCTNQCNEYRYTYREPSGREQVFVVRLCNDGIAFRYELENLPECRFAAEHTTFRIPEGTPRWLQPWSDGYEGFFPLTLSSEPMKVGRGRQTTNRWGYPCLFDLSDHRQGQTVYALFSESNIESRQSASCLYNDGELYRVAPDQNDVDISGSWHTPWRIVMIGTLADIVESTLVTDMAEPSKIADTSWIKPGVVS